MSTFDGSRRSFIKGTAVVAGAAMAAQMIHSRAYAAGNDLIRVGMIGCGGRATGAADQTLSVPNSNVKLVAMCDAFEPKIQHALTELKKKHADKVDVTPDRIFSGLDGYKKLIESCDLVILATPPGFRPQHFEACVAAGKNVFMEKPVCVDAVGARKVLAAAKVADEKGLKVVCGLQRHYQSDYLETLERLRNGEFGEIISGQVYWNGGAIWYRKRAQDQNELQFQVNNWYHFNWLCGDHICEQHVHNLDVANWFIGETPEVAEGMGGRTVMPEGPTEIFDHHYVQYRYKKNGIVLASQCRQISGCKSDVREEFHTSKGILHIGRFTDYSGKELWNRGKDMKAKGAEKDLNAYQVEHNKLHQYIRENTPHNDAYYTVGSTFTAVLGRTATYTGQEWKYADLLAKNWGTFPEGDLSWNTTAPVQPNAEGKYNIPVPGTFKIVEKKA